MSTRMKVKDLIEALSKENPEDEVLIAWEDQYGYPYAVKSSDDGVWINTVPTE